ncbi:oligopeptide:H+ symporter [Rhodanobacter sp. MP7CTX1]|uniref:peptide MFS transporter n=1 Tax=Rhodanobacter sp. MP7CTX1 TaxID=2723084 RepID=UPI0016225747|nr:oligopeptide:H+ symporter [Rhodanobacter sp. MP7CTX1]MBB6189635.1 POT family proton-dependent oligopeptide transporter [Rhodanobacter sp. MP7CTX1]
MNQAIETSIAPDYPQMLGHPRPLWMLFMTEFWERFAFYSVSWALALYIVAHFYNGDPAGQAWAAQIFGSYTALIYASSIFGGYVADKIIGYQRSILIGALVMALGLFAVMLPSRDIFLFGLAMVIVGNGLFKPNISSMVGQLYGPNDDRRDRGFTLFYMGINGGALLAPLLTGWLASYFTDTPLQQNYKLVFGAAGVGMLLSLFWFWFGRRGLRGVGRPAPEAASRMRVVWVLLGVAVTVPLVYLLLAYVGANGLQFVLGPLFVAVAIMLIVEAIRHDRVQLDRVLAMLIIFAFSVLFWMFYFQLGTSFNFLAENLVDRKMFGGWVFPVGWFQSVSPLAIIALAPIVTLIWAFLAKRHKEPSIPRKFGLSLIFNGLGFAVLVYALARLIDGNGLIPFWPLTLCYVLQTVGELCLSPIGLSMVTKLAPPRLVGLAMGGWFLSLAVGGNLSGLLAGHISGENGMTAASALSGFTFSFWLLTGAGVLLLLISPLINKLMHGVR